MDLLGLIQAVTDSASHPEIPSDPPFESSTAEQKELIERVIKLTLDLQDSNKGNTSGDPQQ